MTQIVKKSIVAVDDTPHNLSLLVELLGSQGYRVRTAPNGMRALSTIEKEPPDLILLDILMSDMDGFEVCRRLKADERFRDIPVIFISALGEVFDKVTAFGVGGVDYITKPYQLEEVLARVQTHLELQAMRQKLYEQNQLLQDQNYELEAFAHTVAHDLKNPLTTLMGFLELARQDTTALPKETLELLDWTGISAHKITNIIDELLLLATVRKADIQTTPIDMAQTVNQALMRQSHLVTQYQPEIRLPQGWQSAQGYAPWIEEVWANYISNGMKYGGQPPYLELGSAPDENGMMRFWVRDNGQGLTPEAQASLFTEFTRLDKVRAQGHGLGLSIVRRIMDKLGGEAGVESVLGEGSSFYFTLPASQ